MMMPISPCGIPEVAGMEPGAVERLAGFLSEKPGAAGPSIFDRQVWEAQGRRCPALVKRAGQMLEESSPELTEDLYLECSRTGSRAGYENVYRRRLHRFTVFAMAECIESRARFLPAIEEELGRMLDETTWVMPAHDSLLDNFHGRAVRIDLGAAMRGASIATAVSWLSDRLNPTLRRNSLEELERRIFNPYLQAVQEPETQTTCRWLEGTSNWNAVCTAGVAMAALAILPDLARRAFILAGAVKYLPFYLDGFTADGYCSEGMGYWNYGFGHYVALAEWLLQSSSGRLDLYRNPKLGAIASYPDRLEMSPGLFPAFADCELYPKPASWIRSICNARLYNHGAFDPAVPLETVESDPMLPYLAAVTAFPLAEYPIRKVCAVVLENDKLRGWFPEAGVLVCRTKEPDAGNGLSVCLKGGHNAEHHNHNDVGGFVVAINGRQLIIDPGKEAYTRDTFGPKRYASVLMNSLGHSVPVVAGRLQSDGLQAQAGILDVFFSDEEDRLTLDLSSAYDLPSLNKLERTFSYARRDGGTLGIMDTFEFARPETFEEALITTGSVEEAGEGAWIIQDEEARVLVVLESNTLAWESDIRPLVAKTAPPHALRLSIRLKNPEAKGSMTLAIRPMA